MNKKNIILVASIVIGIAAIGIIIRFFGSGLMTRLLEMHRGG
jgi:hypothetical protein